MFIEIDPRHIDINVHPTKTEIKFDDERTVYAVIRAAVRQALGTHNIAPAIDFSQDVNFANFAPKPEPVKSTSAADRDYSQFKTFERKQDTSHWEKLYEGLKTEISQQEESNRQMEIHPEAQSTITLGSAANVSEEKVSQKPDASYFQIHKKYIATHVKSGLMLIAQQAAHERILYEKFLNQISRRSGASQQALFPQSLKLNSADFSLIHDIREELNAIGFEFSDFGDNSIVINGVPADLKSVNEKALLRALSNSLNLISRN